MRFINKLILILVLSFLIFTNINAQIKIEVIYPEQGDLVTASDSTLIYGNVIPADVNFSINNKRVKVYSNGAFLAFIPVEPGNFSFVCRAISNKDSTTLARAVYIPCYLRTSSSDSLVVDTSYVFPREDWELQPGDIFKVAVKGTPGCKAVFSIDGLVKNLPMAELSPKKSYYWGEAAFSQGTNSQMSDVEGIYTGSYIIQSCDRAIGRKIYFKLINDIGDTVKTTAPGRLTINVSAIPKIAQLTDEVAVAFTGPRLGYQLFLHQGVKIWITGRRRDYLRVRLSETDEIWIKQQKAVILPPGTSLPEGVVSEIRTESLDGWSSVKVLLDQKLPFKVEQVNNPAMLLVTLYGVATNNDLIKLDFDDPLIRGILWEQKARGVYTIKIDLNQEQHWGYDPFYKDRNFYINIKKKPHIAHWLYSPLKNIVVCLDPGHNPDLGAVGPTGITEKDINYEYCIALKNELEKKGAHVVLTHGEKDGITLAARVRMATFIDADILLSLHFNAIPDGVDPFKIRGISTYYYQPQSYRLAHLIQKYLLKKTHSHNFGLFYNNLALCRPPQMIAVLTEPGFLVHPIEEMLITSNYYKKNVVDAIIKAMEQFLKESR